MFALLVVPTNTVWGAEGIQVLASNADYTFSEQIVFALQAESASPIAEVILFYGKQDAQIVRRIYPDFTPGTQIDAQYIEELESGQFAPGTTLRFWWRLVAEDGTALDSPQQTFEYIDTNHDWQVLSGDRVDLYWYGRNNQQAATLLEAADAALQRIETEIGVSVDRRVRVYVYNSTRDMQRALFSRSEVYEESIITLGVMVDTATILLLGPHPDAQDTIAHELSHVVVGLAADNPYTDLPRWLDEGLAMYAEGQLPADNRAALDDAIEQDSLLSIRSMTSYSGQAEQVDLFYGEAYSIADFMLSQYGRDKMVQLLSVFAEGTRQEDALLRVYGLGLDDLNNAWRASLGLGPSQTPAEQPSAVPQQGKPGGVENAQVPAIEPHPAFAAAGMAVG